MEQAEAGAVAARWCGSVRRALPWMGFFASVFTLTACDDTFQPIAPGGQRILSVFGYVDASADTQWIRVMPLRPLQLTSPDSFDVAVTLDRLGAGQTIVLRDSVVRFSDAANPALGSQGAYVHDFWTTDHIQPGASYRFRASLSPGDTAEAVVRIPDYYPVEVSIAQNRGADYVHAAGPEHVPFLGVAARFYDHCGWGADTVWYKAQGDARSFGGEIGRDSVDERGNCGRPTVTGRAFWIVASADPWPAQAAVTDLGATERASNVTNAVGFLGGVLTRTVPYEKCAFRASPGTPIPTYCLLRYDEQTASIHGAIDETYCGDGPMDSVTVILSELDRDPAKVRTVFSDPTGAYAIGGLEPGVRYMVKDSALPEIDPFWGEITIYDDPVDTIELAPGEQRVTDVDMKRITYCPDKPARGCPQCRE